MRRSRRKLGRKENLPVHIGEEIHQHDPGQNREVQFAKKTTLCIRIWGFHDGFFINLLKSAIPVLHRRVHDCLLSNTRFDLCRHCFLLPASTLFWLRYFEVSRCDHDRRVSSYRVFLTRVRSPIWGKGNPSRRTLSQLFSFLSCYPKYSSLQSQSLTRSQKTSVSNNERKNSSQSSPGSYKAQSQVNLKYRRNSHTPTVTMHREQGWWCSAGRIRMPNIETIRVDLCHACRARRFRPWRDG